MRSALHGKSKACMCVKASTRSGNPALTSCLFAFVMLTLVAWLAMYPPSSHAEKSHSDSRWKSRSPSSSNFRRPTNWAIPRPLVHVVWIVSALLFKCLSFSYTNVSCQTSGVSAISNAPYFRFCAYLQGCAIVTSLMPQSYYCNILYEVCLLITLLTLLPDTDEDEEKASVVSRAPFSAIGMPDLSITSTDRLLYSNGLDIYFGIHGKPSLCISTASWKI